MIDPVNPNAWDKLVKGRPMFIRQVDGQCGFVYRLSPGSMIRLGEGRIMGRLMKKEKKLSASFDEMRTRPWQVFQTWLDAGCPDSMATELGKNQ